MKKTVLTAAAIAVIALTSACGDQDTTVQGAPTVAKTADAAKSAEAAETTENTQTSENTANARSERGSDTSSQRTKGAQKIKTTPQKQTNSDSDRTGSKTAKKGTTQIFHWKKLGNRTGFKTHDGRVHCVTEPQGQVICGVDGDPSFTMPTSSPTCDADLMPFVKASANIRPYFMCLSDAWTPIATTHTTVPKKATIYLPSGTSCTVTGNQVKCSFAQKHSFTFSPKKYHGVNVAQAAKPKTNKKTISKSAYTFLTADKSVLCSYDAQARITCGAKNPNYVLPKTPARCAGADFGATISARPGRAAQLDCTTDYFYTAKAPVVKAGTTVRGPKGLQCSVTNTTVTCAYSGKSAFSYSATKYTLG